MKKILSSLCVPFLILILIMLFKSQLFRISPLTKINYSTKEELARLATGSLKNFDVPVSSLLLYKDEIVGKGHNTVLKDTSAGAHAEINAISDALKKIGFLRFDNLNRDSLILISTFEPCPMCKGAIQEYKIKHVQFVKEKSIAHWLQRELGDFMYEINKRKSDAANLQDSLFRLHPGFTDD